MKTRSVEAGAGISKGGVHPHYFYAPLKEPLRASKRGYATSLRVRADCIYFSTPVTGMQNNGLTMFAGTCYSKLVPRVYLGLLCAARFREIVREAAAELLRKAFPD